MTLLLGLLKEGRGIDVDFDNEFIPTEKIDALYSYKKRGYFQGVMTPGPLLIGVENRQGNSNVKFKQVEELTRMLDIIEAHGLQVRMFRANCGSFVKELSRSFPCGRRRSTSVPAAAPSAGGCMSSAGNGCTWW